MKHPVDIVAAATYVAGGGLAGVFALLAQFYPVHAAQFNSGAIALVSIAGLIRIVFNPTPPPGQVAVTTKGPTTP